RGGGGGRGRVDRPPRADRRSRAGARGIGMDAFDRDDDPHREVRDGVRRLCADFPGEYWRELDRPRASPAEFVKAVTAAGYLSALIPEEYGGSGLPLPAAAAIPEGIQPPRGHRPA